MNELLSLVLNRIDSRYFAELWTFFRDYFQSDTDCLAFIAEVFRFEPENTSKSYHEISGEQGRYINEDGKMILDAVFIPRRMLNAVLRFVLAARDMDLIRKSKDIFKLVYIITCIETIQTLSTNEDYKKEMLISFFEENISESDKNVILGKFKRSLGDKAFSDNQSSIREFAGVLNEYRNSAAHEGKYWNYCFNNNTEKCTSLLVLSIDLKNFSRKNKEEHVFETELSYKEFEEIFVRKCIQFIQKYLDARNSDS